MATQDRGRRGYFPAPVLGRLPRDARRVITARAKRLGFVPNFHLLYSLRPRHLVRWIAHYDELMLGASELSVLERELIAFVVSRTNQCHYCATTHGARLRTLSGHPDFPYRIARNYRRAGLDKKTVAMLDFAVHTTRHPGATSASALARLRRYGFSDRAVWDVLEIAAMFNFTNRLASGAGIVPNPEYRQMGRAPGSGQAQGI